MKNLVPGTRYRLHIRKDALKFASAHMTLLPDGTKEPIHGHNYTIELTAEVEKAPVDKMLTFSVLKEAASALCSVWDESLLLPQKASALKMVEEADDDEIEFKLCDKRYVLPREEVRLLPCENITTESLVEIFGQSLLEMLNGQPGTDTLCALTVRIDESSGQGASFDWRAP